MTNRKQDGQPVRVALISLGCAKNLADAEVMLGALIEDGMEITADADRADAVIVNTCSFLDAAQEESVDAILEADARRTGRRRRQGLVVAGCLSQRNRQELPRLLPEVDAFMGIDQVAETPEIVRAALARRAATTALSRRSRSRSHGRPRPSPPPPPVLAVHARPTLVLDYASPRFRLTPPHFAYIKIAEGCNHPCSFCIIPQLRGRHRSRDPADIVREARDLVESGVRELNLISQDSTYYGRDLRRRSSGWITPPGRSQPAARALEDGAPSLPALLRALNDLPGEFWIRLLYTHPAHWTDELIETIAACPKVARYVDIPLQHIQDNVLERMRRETSREQIVDLLERIRAGIPGIALRTTFIVGFPGETEACFQALLDFVRETRFERLGVFTYSREDQTRAGRMAGQIPNRVKQRRRDRLMTTQREIARQIAASSVGRTLKVLIERAVSAADRVPVRAAAEHGWLRAENGSQTIHPAPSLIARSEHDAPEIDGRVFVRGTARVGTFVRVRVVGHTDYDLLAEPVRTR